MQHGNMNVNFPTANFLDPSPMRPQQGRNIITQNTVTAFSYCNLNPALKLSHKPRWIPPSFFFQRSPIQMRGQQTGASCAVNQKGNHAVWQVLLSSGSDTVSHEQKDQYHSNKNKMIPSLVWKPTGHKGNDYCRWNCSSISLNDKKKLLTLLQRSDTINKRTHCSDTYTETPRTADSKKADKNTSFTRLCLDIALPPMEQADTTSSGVSNAI